jgi:hypothetical protein
LWPLLIATTLPRLFLAICAMLPAPRHADAITPTLPALPPRRRATAIADFTPSSPLPSRYQPCHYAIDQPEPMIFDTMSQPQASWPHTPTDVTIAGYKRQRH